MYIIIFVREDTNVCLTDSGTCDPTATCAGNGTTRNCSFGTPPPASNGSQNIGGQFGACNPVSRDLVVCHAN